MKDFGAFVNFGFKHDGLVHKTRIREDKRPSLDARKEVEVGQIIEVRISRINGNKISLIRCPVGRYPLEG